MDNVSFLGRKTKTNKQQTKTGSVHIEMSLMT